MLLFESFLEFINIFFEEIYGLFIMSDPQKQEETITMRDYHYVEITINDVVHQDKMVLNAQKFIRKHLDRGSNISLCA
jgi:hypothetical protein